jgi:hypothetical protein
VLLVAAMVALMLVQDFLQLLILGQVVAVGVQMPQRVRQAQQEALAL